MKRSIVGFIKISILIVVTILLVLSFYGISHIEVTIVKSVLPLVLVPMIGLLFIL